MMWVGLSSEVTFKDVRLGLGVQWVGIGVVIGIRRVNRIPLTLGRH